ncbi:MAG: EthD family reductase [Rhodospirillaceae bacterium]
MFKLIALYKAPQDPDAFMAHYQGTHVPLVHKVPGLVKVEVTKVVNTLMGEPGNFLLAEMYFADETSYKQAMKSPENAAAGKDLGAFAGGLVTLMKGEVLELR